MKEKAQQTEIKSAINAISTVKHPAIDCSLAELGILQDIELYTEDTIIATFVFPFQKIPVKDRLINAVRKVAADFGYKFEYIVRYMNKNEKAHFLELEKIHWKEQ